MTKKAAAAPATIPSFVGEENGITAAMLDNGSFAVAFSFDRQLNALMRNVPGAELDKNAAERTFVVPAASKDELAKALQSMRTGAHFIAEDLNNIKTLASGRGHDAQRNNGAAHNVAAQVSDYIEPGRYYSGEVLAVNGHFAAQLTGFGKEDGAAFVAIHRLANLDNANVLKGDKIGVKYDEKFLGSVSDLSKSKSKEDLAAEFDATQGMAIDGVTATDRGATIGVKFDLDPVLLARIKRLDGADFNRDEGLWEIPVASKSFALRAINDMRNEFVHAANEVSGMRAIAESKLDGAKVQHAFMKDGFEHFGKVIAVGERYVLQKGGKDSFALHHLASLDQKPEVGQSLAIKYNRGVGAVVDQEQKRSQEKALSTGR